MTVPGPPAALGGAELVLTVAVVVLVGEGVRTLLARVVPLLRRGHPFERILLDLYLGGAVYYGVAALPNGFTSGSVTLATAVGLAALAYSTLRATRAGRLGSSLRQLARPVGSPFALVSLAGAVGLFVLEWTVAAPVATGNTFDSSVDTLFAALLTFHGTLPTSLSPVASGMITYPQGSTVWFGLVGGAAGFPPSRTALLVTPLFMALVPLAGFVLGRRWLGTDSAGAAFALFFTLMGPGTRYLAGGSNDFALAVPLVLLLAAWTREMWTSSVPSWRDAAAFGAIAGYSAALNPVGSEWLFLLLLVGLGFTAGGSGKHALAGAARWLLAVAASLPWVAPSINGLVLSGASSVPGAVPGISLGQFVSLADPFVVRPTVTSFSPFPLLTVELAVLLALGAFFLLWPSLRPGSSGIVFGRWVLAGIVSGLLWLGVGLLARLGVPGFSTLLATTSPGEMSSILFTLYGLLAAIPLAVLLRQWDRPTTAVDSPETPPADRRSPRRRGRALGEERMVALGLAVALLAPGTVLTVSDLPPYLASLYGSFSNVTASDFDLLTWAGTHLPAGARVLVAPGSAAEFLPGYNPRLVLLFPMTGVEWRANAAYLDLRTQLANGTLGPNGTAELAALGVQYIAVTGNSTVLYPAFSPSPFLSDLAYATAFHEGDAYLFERIAPFP